LICAVEGDHVVLGRLEGDPLLEELGVDVQEPPEEE
jgi:hypothetical protein